MNESILQTPVPVTGPAATPTPARAMHRPRPSTGNSLLSWNGLEFRHPRIEDGHSIWKIVKDSGVLDENSCYAYLILCSHFADTCVVVENEGRVVGFATAYRPPLKEDVMFLWQIGMEESLRGRGIAKKLLHVLISVSACREVRYLETTVTPSNIPSRKLFQSLARDHRAHCDVTPWISSGLFKSRQHEPEHLFRVGPLKRHRK